MKTQVLSIIGILFLATFFSSCENKNYNDRSTEYTTVLDVQDDGTSAIITSDLKSVTLDTPVTSSSDEELLLHMKDEEKLARDVYYTLYLKWGNQIFNNIAAAEQKHLDAIMLLIDNYSDLLVEEGDAGQYENEEFLQLFNELTARGSESVEEAYSVGALIEELDIYDLDNFLTQTTNENMILVFENLLRGSRNHLRAFYRNLETLGLTYTPSYLDDIAFADIVSSPMEQGKRYAKQNGKRYGNGGNGQGGPNGSGDGTCNQ